jgi:peptidoglycan hydrolase-like protein with peptidoglycan-binding domain
MATTKKQISYGSRGDEVKELQTALNNAGYSLDVDGSFGSKTQAAVKDYQKKNNLAVDGIVGNNTWGSLLGSSSASGSASSSTSNKTTTTTNNTPTGFTYDPYKESNTVAAAKKALQAQLNNKPDAYQSTYQQQITDVLNKIMNREPFEYDLNGDALYQQYKDQYTTQGKMAMMDTMGQAAALTGGYGNSYAQNAGQQAYHGYLQQLNNKVPELYQLALDQYNRKGDDLLSQYSLYADRENMDYGRYRDDLGDYYANLDRLTNQYQTERDTDYGRYADALNLAYQISRDQAADKQWQTEFDENLRRWNYANGLNADGTPIATTSKSGSGRDKGETLDIEFSDNQQDNISALNYLASTGKYSAEEIAKQKKKMDEKNRSIANTQGNTYYDAWKKYINSTY